MPDAVSTTTSVPGAALRSRGSVARPSSPGIERSSRTRSGWSSRASSSAAAPSAASPTTSKPPCAEQGRERIPGQGMVVDDENALRHRPSHRQRPPCRLGVRAEERQGHIRGMARRRAAARRPAGLGDGSLPDEPDPAQHLRAAGGRLVLDTAVVLAATIVAILAGVRFSVEGRVLDLLLAAGFFVAGVGTLAFSVLPVLGGEDQGAPEAWAAIGARVLAGDPDRAGAGRPRAPDPGAEARAARRDRDPPGRAAGALAAAARVRQPALSSSTRPETASGPSS